LAKEIAVTTSTACVAAAAPILLLALGVIPTRWANRHARSMGRLTELTTTLVFCAALLVATNLAITSRHAGSATCSLPLAPGWGVYLDALSAVMLLLIAFIGLIIARFSIRYLRGDPREGRFLKWTCFTLGSVLTLVLSANLVMFTVAWIMTSFGLHQLLTHFEKRRGAVMAARNKFLISRLGDLFLTAAMVLIVSSLGSGDFATIFAAADQLRADSQPLNWALSLGATFLVLGAMTKSAQFPMHSWLPDTMETPTPVSALMHAGIINAGGFLVIRLSPLISLSHLALDLLAVVGTLTAVIGSVIMLTQPSVKRTLAYSTMAQMGFMMLQCGLGAFAAALLHIVAHSLYKAHAFLSSGSVLEVPPSATLGEAKRRAPLRYLQLPLALGSALSIVALSSQFNSSAKNAGGLALALVLTFALASILWNSLRVARLPVIAMGLVMMVAVAFLYRGLVGAFALLLANGVAPAAIAPSAVDVGLAVLVAISFSFLFLLQLLVSSAHATRLAETFYVHAYNGFYLDLPLRKLVNAIWKKPSVC
jgi:NAD(P)H-quinone oxidoreductase subunit 5